MLGIINLRHARWRPYRKIALKRSPLWSTIGAAALLSACVVAATPPSPPADRGDSMERHAQGCTSNRPAATKLMFLSNRPGGARAGNYDLFEADLDGANVRRLTDFPSYSIRWFDRDPTTGRIVVAASSGGDLTIGPSGGHGAAEGGEQTIAILEGSEMRFLVDIRPGGNNPESFVGVWHATFSPDGQRVAYSGTKQGESANLWIQNIDGSGLRRLINDPHRTHQDPRFTPDGRVVFIRHDRRGLGQIADPNGLDVWILDPDSPESARPITREAAIPGPPRIETDPAMSPDCIWVASIRATEPFGLTTLLRPASDNVAFTVDATGREAMRTMQKGEQPLRVHGVPTWIDSETILSYRWETRAEGWRVVRYRIDSPDGQVAIMDLGAPKGSEDLLPLAY